MVITRIVVLLLLAVGCTVSVSLLNGIGLVERSVALSLAVGGIVAFARLMSRLADWREAAAATAGL